jgi:hypothetical protein
MPNITSLMNQRFPGVNAFDNTKVVDAFTAAARDGGGITATELTQIQKLPKTEGGRVAMNAAVDLMEIELINRGVRFSIDPIKLENEIAGRLKPSESFYEQHHLWIGY